MILHAKQSIKDVLCEALHSLMYLTFTVFICRF